MAAVAALCIGLGMSIGASRREGITLVFGEAE